MRSMKPLIMLLGVAVAASALAACNTVKGVGKDVAAAGRAVTGAAQSVENDSRK